jgi:hypothetical protein
MSIALEQHTLHLPPLPLGEEVMVDELLVVSARLTALLQEESQLLKRMQVGKIGPMQDEKLKLIAWLEAQQKMLMLKPQMKQVLQDNERFQLEEASAALSAAMNDNVHQLSIARAVNSKVVEAVMEALRQQQQVPGYTSLGAAKGAAPSGALPVNINQKA